jgi:hypothetical protein
MFGKPRSSSWDGLPPFLADLHRQVPLPEGADERVVVGDGEPVAWRVALAGDEGYRAAWIDDFLPAMEVAPVIPSEENEDREDRTVGFDREA